MERQVCSLHQANGSSDVAFQPGITFGKCHFVSLQRGGTPRRSIALLGIQKIASDLSQYHFKNISEVKLIRSQIVLANNVIAA